MQDKKEIDNDFGLHIFHRPIGFFVVIFYKGLWGIVECIVGFILLFSQQLVHGELIEDPQDRFMNWLLRMVEPNYQQWFKVGAIIGLIGISKIFFSFGLWYWPAITRKIGLFFLTIFAIFTLFEMRVHVSWWKVIALIIDTIIIYYFWKILPKHIHQDKVL